MDKKYLKDCLGKGMSITKISKECEKGKTTVRYWLTKYNMRSPLKGPTAGLHNCKCGEKDPTKFYGRKRTVCAKCHNEYSKGVARKNKLKAIEYLGGSCNHCKGVFIPSVYDIHHRDPSLKDPKFDSIMSRAWVNIQRELDKCDLLCANCHRIEHHELKV